MKPKYHRQITTQALDPFFDPSRLSAIISANLGQDALWYQFGHDHFHYDNNSFAVSDAYVNELREKVLASIAHSDISNALIAFGRLTHTVQDFYAHSNYVGLWKDLYPTASPEDIEPASMEIIQSSKLASGRIYYPLEFLAFFSALRPMVLPFLPKDSHAWMNIDGPEIPVFDYAFQAASKRTLAEFDLIRQSLPAEQIRQFCGK